MGMKRAPMDTKVLVLPKNYMLSGKAHLHALVAGHDIVEMTNSHGQYKLL